MSKAPWQPPTFILNADGHLEMVGGPPPPTAEELAERKKFGARCGHIKRRLRKNEPLTGELLELALSIVGAGDGEGPNDDVLRSMAKKLNAGEPLGDYEMHLMLDVFLLHARLAA